MSPSPNARPRAAAKSFLCGDEIYFSRPLCCDHSRALGIANPEAIMDNHANSLIDYVEAHDVLGNNTA